MPRDSNGTREKILEAATRLFYAEGVRAVSMDAVAAKAGLTKKTLYYHFESKDGLVAEYLASQDQPTLELYQRWFAETPGALPDKVRGMFDRFASSASRSSWRGCGFLRTTAELAGTPGHPAIKAGAAHKKRFEAWLVEVFERQNLREAAVVARQIIVLLDGAATVMLIHRDANYVRVAADVAVAAIENAMAGAPTMPGVADIA